MSKHPGLETRDVQVPFSIFALALLSAFMPSVTFEYFFLSQVAATKRDMRLAEFLARIENFSLA